MVWTTQGELETARMSEPLFAADSLFDKAKTAGIASNKKAPEFPGFLDNTQFLGELVRTGKIRQDQAATFQATVAAGSKLYGDETQHKNLQKELFFSSLPETYAYSDIAQRLAKSGRLTTKDKVGHRLANTDGMIEALMTGLANGSGTGLHLAFLLGARHERLSEASGDQLINQVTPAFTLLTFSFTPFAAMNRGDLTGPTREEQQAWLEMWNVVGSLMGIGRDGLPATLEQATALDELIRVSDEYRRTEQGEKLITALVELSNNKRGSSSSLAARTS